MFKTHRTFELTPGVKNNSIAVFHNNGTIGVLYHKTQVFTAKAMKSGGWKVEIRDGGWNTISTRIVINNAFERLVSGSYFLYTKKGQTYIQIPFSDVTKDLPFDREMTLRIKS